MRIMFRHILPNTLGPVVVAGTLAVATAILVEAALSFLGFGIKPPTTSLGVLVASGQNNPQKWWVTVFPGLTIVLIVLPFLGVFIYLIAHGSDMATRSANQVADNRAQFDDYVRNVAASDGPAAEIDRAKKLLDEGTINQAEYDSIKGRALAAG